MINESQCYRNILSVHHNYIIVSLVGPKVILKAGEVAMMGLGVGILAHQNKSADERQMDRERAWKRERNKMGTTTICCKLGRGVNS